MLRICFEWLVQLIRNINAVWQEFILSNAISKKPQSSSPSSSLSKKSLADFNQVHQSYWKDILGIIISHAYIPHSYNINSKIHTDSRVLWRFWLSPEEDPWKFWRTGTTISPSMLWLSIIPYSLYLSACYFFVCCQNRCLRHFVKKHVMHARI